MCAKSLQSCPALCDSMDCSLPGSSVHGILQARILEWVAISFSRESSPPGMEPAPPALAGGFLTTSTNWEAQNNDKCHTEVSLHFFRGDAKMLFLGLWVGTFKGGLLQLTKMKGFILDKRAERRLGENRGHQGKNP